MPTHDPITETMQAAIEQGVFPGAVLLVRQGGRLRYHRAFGYAALSPDRRLATVDTVYDLASLTKPLATTTALLCLVQDGRVRLEDPITRYLPEMAGGGAGDATVFHLLNHSAGLAAWLPLYERVAERERQHAGFLGSDAARRLALEIIRDEPLAYPVGEKSMYSDLGFILLGLLIERISGRSLAQFCRERVYDPLGARSLYFGAGPAGESSECRESLASIAVTEDDPWRGRILQGEVHDENAYALGGAAGHAGLFGTAAGVAAVTGLWLEGYAGKTGFLSSDLVRRFVSRQFTPGSTWALGWDTPSAPSSSGRHFSSRAFGHLGFTGTSVWIDPICGLEIVLLSNRVHPTRRNTMIQKFRPVIHDRVYERLVGSGG